METILIVDDNEINRKILGVILSKDYLTMEAENGAEAIDLLEKHSSEIAAVMLDLVMPVMTGYEFLHKIKEADLYNTTPIIVTTGDSNNENEKNALKLGAWDFVCKPYDADIIKFRLKNAIDRSQLSAFKRLKYLAEYDGLTGIYNKSKFFHTTMEMLYTNRDKNFVFIRFDIDRFQLINSFYGTEEGDRLLKYIAKNLTDFAKAAKIGTFGRIEADIFGICIPYYDEIQIKRQIEHARKILERFNPSYDIVPTFGVYLIDDITMPIDLMYDKASLASKKGKGNYVNYYSFYDEKMSDNIVKEQEITNNMNAALANNQFIVYLQPKYDLVKNIPTGAEALVRWNIPETGIIPPGEFIPIFERNGFISKLDFYVWEKVCILIRKWLDEGKKVNPVSVNVSRVNLYNPRLVDIIVELTEKYDIPPTLLNLELTESAYTDNPVAMRDAMSKLQSKGFSIMMDDFGSGYSSLNVLKDIAVDVLKIDMRFLSKTSVEGRGENIIASVIRMAKWLNIPVVAEGAETKQQVDFLRSIGCEFCQGFYFAKPMPVSEYETLMENTQVFYEDAADSSEFDADMLWSLNPQMEMLFNNGLQAVAIYEFDGENIELIRMNKTFTEILGQEYRNFSRKLIDVVYSIYQPIVINTFKTAVETKNTANCEYLRKSGEDNWVWVDIRLKYINKVGDKHLLFGTLADITLQKEIDIELQRYRNAVLGKNEQSRTMLIVDDLEISRVVLREIFQEEYNILEAANGVEAIAQLDQNDNVGIILLDLMMPVMNGKEFLAYRKNDPKIAGIPVIMITAEDNEEEQVKILEIGVNDYIVKPFVKEIVKRRVNNVLESNRSFIKSLKEI